MASIALCFPPPCSKTNEAELAHMDYVKTWVGPSPMDLLTWRSDVAMLSVMKKAERKTSLNIYCSELKVLLF